MSDKARFVETADRWPFTCTPDQLARRLEWARETFGAMLPAVRCVFIEGGSVGCDTHSTSPLLAPAEDATTYAECTGDETCRMCGGEICNLCGAGLWRSPSVDGKPCEHDSMERHENPR